MKRLLCVLLVLLLAGIPLSGCDRRSSVTPDDAPQEGNFSPETTAVGGLTQAVEDQVAAPEEEAEDETVDVFPPTESSLADVLPEDVSSIDERDEGIDSNDAQEVVQDEPIEQDADAEGTPEVNMPFATPTPQPNAFVTDYEEVSASGLGFRFSHPSDWQLIPGRSTVCYVQPMKEGTVYPARVSVTMKRMAHVSNYEEAQNQLGYFLRSLLSLYDQSTFAVDFNLDYTQQFMGNNAIGTTYLAYDGSQEIKGYAIITFYDRYLFMFHFLCAYEDYNALEEAMLFMRNSVMPDASVAPK